MSPVPVAAALSSRPRSLDLERRLRRLLERSADGTAGALAERLLPATPSVQTTSLRHGGYYWLEVPEWLAASFGLDATAAGRRLLDDLLWAQYCVFALFRAQDDLVDGAAPDPRIAVEANCLLLEATRRAALHFDASSAFWRVYRESIEQTSRAVLRLDRLQRSPHRPDGAELELYAEQAACLGIAAAGVSVAAGRETEWRQRIAPALSQLAVAAQIVDDLRDLREDLDEGRVNYVAWRLCRPVVGATAEAVEAVVAFNLATGGRLSELLHDAARRLAGATVAVAEVDCPELAGFLEEYGQGLVAYASELDRRRRDLFAEPAAA